MNCGIYKITSPSGKLYIGQSIDIKRRISKYASLNCKQQTYLYNSLKKYGFNNHKFEVIHECRPEELNALEEYYINLHGVFNSKNGLNLRSGGGNCGRMSEASRQKMKVKKTGRTLAESHKEKISIANKGRKFSEEHRKNISISKTGVPFSHSHRERVVVFNKSRRGQKMPQEIKRKISVALKGRMPKNIELFKAVLWGRPVSKETRLKMRESHLGKKYTKK